LGTGTVPDQKLTGYKTTSGIYKIFFYGGDGTLSCMTSRDLKIWEYHYNF